MTDENLTYVETLDENGNVVYVKSIANAAGESLSGVEKDAQVNKLEKVKIHGVEIQINGKAVDIPAYTRDEADAKFLQSSDIANKADKATTLAGYGISDAYTKTETESRINSKIASTYKPGGTKTLATLPALTADNLGFVYNMSADFTTTADLVEGAGKKFKAGVDVGIVNVGTDENPTYKYNVLAGFVDTDKYDSHVEDTDVHVTTADKSNWNGKQDAISDLSTIRSNASAGKSASDTISEYGDIVSHDASEFATAGHNHDAAYQAKITSSNKLSADLVEAGSTNAIVTLTEKSTYDGYAAQIASKADATQTANAIASKADKATTLAGYGINDAYTKTEAKQTFLSFRVVQ